MARHTKSIGVAFIGTGAIMQGCHIPNFRNIDGVELIAVCDVVENRARSVAEKHGIPNALTQYRDLLKRDDVDAVVVAVPTFLHAPIAINALKAGKHVLCEKPPALNARQAQRMAKVAKDTRRVLTYGLQMLYESDVEMVKQMVDNGEFGEVYLGKASYLRRRGAPRGWFSEKDKSGGGALIDIGVHLINLTWWLMGNPEPVRASGITFDRIGMSDTRFQAYQPMDVREGTAKASNPDVDEAAAGMIRFANGAVMLIETSWQLNIKGPGGAWSAQIFGDAAGAKLPSLEIYRNLNGLQTNVTAHTSPTNGYIAEAEHFIECIRYHKQPRMTPEHGVTLMKIIDALYRSSESGREVAIR